MQLTFFFTYWSKEFEIVGSFFVFVDANSEDISSNSAQDNFHFQQRMAETYGYEKIMVFLSDGK